MTHSQTPIFPEISIQRLKQENALSERVTFSTIIRKEHEGIWYQFLVILRQINSTFGVNWDIRYVVENDDQYQKFIRECYKALLLTDMTYKPKTLECIEIYKIDINQISEIDRIKELVLKMEI